MRPRRNVRDSEWEPIDWEPREADDPSNEEK